MGMEQVIRAMITLSNLPWDWYESEVSFPGDIDESMRWMERALELNGPVGDCYFKLWSRLSTIHIHRFERTADKTWLENAIRYAEISVKHTPTRPMNQRRFSITLGKQ